jgi:hypothetical protein
VGARERRDAATAHAIQNGAEPCIATGTDRAGGGDTEAGGDFCCRPEA